MGVADTHSTLYNSSKMLTIPAFTYDSVSTESFYD